MINLATASDIPEHLHCRQTKKKKKSIHSSIIPPAATAQSPQAGALRRFATRVQNAIGQTGRDAPFDRQGM